MAQELLSKRFRTRYIESIFWSRVSLLTDIPQIIKGRIIFDEYIEIMTPIPCRICGELVGVTSMFADPVESKCNQEHPKTNYLFYKDRIQRLFPTPNSIQFILINRGYDNERKNLRGTSGSNRDSGISDNRMSEERNRQIKTKDSQDEREKIQGGITDKISIQTCIQLLGGEINYLKNTICSQRYSKNLRGILKMRDELEILFTNLSDFPGDEGLIELQRIIKDNLEEEEVFLPENCELAAKIIEELKIQSIQVKTTSKRTKKARQAIELDNFDFEDIEL